MLAIICKMLAICSQYVKPKIEGVIQVKSYYEQVSASLFIKNMKIP